MSEPLDHLVERLAVSPTDRSLENFDSDVSRGVARWRAQARSARALAPVRVASVSLALAMGVAVGGVTAAASIAVPGTSAVLSGSNLAPSTLLEGGQ